MVYLYSNYIIENEGYPGETQFGFNLDHFASSTIISARWIWGDGSITTNTDLNATKTYSNIGQYTVTLKLIHLPPGSKKSQTYDWQTTITIKKPFTKNFLITTSADPSKPTIYARATKINLTPIPELYGKNGEKIKFIQWDLGNGVITNKFSLIGATYDQPGMYEITMLVYDLNGRETVSKQLITVEEYLNDSIKFVRVPPPTYAGHLNRYTFKIEITSTVDSEPHIIDLYAQFSKSQPLLDYPTKYSFLRSQWRFLDKNLNPIKFIQTTDEEVRINEKGNVVNSGGTVVGVRGYAEFYFVDDWYNFDQVLNGEQCTTLWATLRSNSIRTNKITDNVDGLHPGHANNTAQAWCPYVTLWRKPDTLQITSNGMQDIPEIQWAGSDIPLVIKIGYKNAVVLDNHNSEGIIQLPDKEKGFAHYIPNNKNEKTFLDLGFSNMTNAISSYLNPSEYPLVIKHTDENQFMTGGYYKTIFEKKDPGIVSLSATLSAYEPVLYGETYNPFLWLPDATNAKVTAAQYIFTKNAIINSPQYFNTNEIDTYKQFFKEEKRKIATVKKNPNLNTALINNLNVAVKRDNYVSSIYDNKNRLSGLYAVAALNSPTYHAWVSDVENDLIYRLTTSGSIYNVIKLSEILSGYGKSKFTPHSMVVDKDLNLFVALWDAGMVVKFNDGGVLLKVLVLDREKPVCVEVDVDNFILISCVKDKNVAFGERGSLKKYSNDLNVLRGNLYYFDIEPGNIIADSSGGVYVVRGGHLTNARQIYRSLSNIDKIKWSPSISDPSLTGILPENAYIEKNYNKYPAIKHLCLDRDDNLYFTYGYNNVGKIKKEDGKFSFLNIVPDTLNDKVNNNILDGLAYNINHKIYVINSIDNKVIALDPDTMAIESSFYINPSKIEYETDSNGNLLKNNGNFILKASPYICSLRANGDWTGWRWSYKFTYKLGTNMYFLSGECKNIWLAQPEAYKFFTKTENFNMAKYMRDFSFMPSLQDSPFLFDNTYNNTEKVQETVDSVNLTRRGINAKIYNLEGGENLLGNEEELAKLKQELNDLDGNIQNIRQPLSDQKGFFGSIFGTYPYEPNDPGLKLYDKIANFVGNSGDPDICDLKHLQEMMRKIKFEDNDFKFYFPEGLTRIVDNCSINPSRLMGVVCNCGDIYNKNEYNVGTCSYCGREKLLNKGEQIFAGTYNVSAGYPIILKNRGTQKYRKINTGILNNQSIYNLSVLASSIGLPEYWGNFYEFYQYIPNSTLIPNLSSSDYMTENIIDWNNQQTTLPKNQNTEQWYEKNGLIDRMINFELQKGLGLI